MLSDSAQKMINQYLNLPFENISGVRCPYFNNARLKQKGQLRVLIGKGTPQEIVSEAKIMSIQYGHQIFDKNGLCHLPEEEKVKELKKYLVDHGLGIDCSGFVLQVLDQHFLEKHHLKLSSALFIASAKNIIRWIISKLRPIENISVKTMTRPENSQIIKKLDDIKEADIITMLSTGPNHKRDHVLLITKFENNTIHYVHARAWSSEGQYGHGVARGVIKIINKDKPLLDQEWQEFSKINEQNETFLEAKNAQDLVIRRFKI